jgi:hypothetical protein
VDPILPSVQADVGGSDKELPPKSKVPEMSAEDAGQWKSVHSAARWGKIDDINRMVRSSNVDLQDPMNGNFTIHIAAQVRKNA